MDTSSETGSDRPLRLLIVGSGNFALHHAVIFDEMDHVTVAGFVSRDLDRAKAAANKLAASKSAANKLASKTGGQAAAYCDLTKALDAERPDFAVLTVPPGAHGEIEFALIERGIPFLTEKPLGREPSIPREIASRLAQSGLLAAAAFQMRYYDTNEQFAELLSQGTPILSNAFYMVPLPPPVWWRHKAESGGQFVEQTIHMTDALRFFLGEAESVAAMTTQSAIKELHADADVPDAGAAVIRMKCGITATIINSCMGAVRSRVGLEIVTTAGFLETSYGAISYRTAEETIEASTSCDAYVRQNAAFAHAVASGQTDGIRSPYADALKTHELAMAIVESARTGQVVQLSSGA